LINPNLNAKNAGPKYELQKPNESKIVVCDSRPLSSKKESERGMSHVLWLFFLRRAGGSTQANQNEDSANEGGKMK